MSEKVTESFTSHIRYISKLNIYAYKLYKHKNFYDINKKNHLDVDIKL